MTATTSVITIDGPSAAGKSVLCKEMAKILQWNTLDSGAIYRVLALAALHHHINLTSEEALTVLAVHLNIRFIYTNGNFTVLLWNKDVSNEIRTQKIANIASRIAIFPRMRKAILRLQRTFREEPGLIADGRDMGTIVFPDALVKIFLDASLKVRTNRRMLQLQRKGIFVKYETLLSEIKERDYHDRNRYVAPLLPAKDALFLDSTSLTIEQIIEKALQYANKRLNLTDQTGYYHTSL